MHEDDMPPGLEAFARRTLDLERVAADGTVVLYRPRTAPTLPWRLVPRG